MIKPDWKPVSELKNMTYEEWKEVASGKDMRGFLIQLVDKTIPQEVYRLRSIYHHNELDNLDYDDINFSFKWNYKTQKSLGLHVSFATEGGEWASLNSVLMFAPFDVTPPEEE